MRIADEWDIKRDENLHEELVESINERGRFRVGGIYGVVGTITNIFIHFESECCWLYARDRYGNLWYIDVTEEVPW